MEIILALVIVASSFMTSMDNAALRQQNDVLRLENQKLTIEREYIQKDGVKDKKKKTVENSVEVIYSLNQTPFCFFPVQKENPGLTGVSFLYFRFYFDFF